MRDSPGSVLMINYDSDDATSLHELAAHEDEGRRTYNLTRAETLLMAKVLREGRDSLTDDEKDCINRLLVNLYRLLEGV